MLQKDMIPPLKDANYVDREDGGSKFFRNLGTYRQYYSAQQPNSGLGHLVFEASTSHTIEHTHAKSHAPSKTPLSECSGCRTGRYLHDTQQTQERIISVFSGIRKHSHNNHEVASLRLRPRGHDL